MTSAFGNVAANVFVKQGGKSVEDRVAFVAANVRPLKLNYFFSRPAMGCSPD